MNIKTLITQTAAKVGKTKFIGIDGRGGSGKSTLAKILSKKLNAQIIHTDDFATQDNPFEWQDSLINTVFNPIISGAKTLNYHPSKWWPDHHPEPVINQPVTQIMILEGVTALRKQFRPYLSLSIFVDTPANICLARGLERDKDNSDLTPHALTALWQEWAEFENSYLAQHNPQSYADLVISGTKKFNFE